MRSKDSKSASPAQRRSSPSSMQSKSVNAKWLISACPASARSRHESVRQEDLQVSRAHPRG